MRSLFRCCYMLQFWFLWCFWLLLSYTTDHCVCTVESFTSGFNSAGYPTNHNPPHSPYIEFQAGVERIPILIFFSLSRLVIKSEICRSTDGHSNHSANGTVSMLQLFKYRDRLHHSQIAKSRICRMNSELHKHYFHAGVSHPLPFIRSIYFILPGW